MPFFLCMNVLFLKVERICHRLTDRLNWSSSWRRWIESPCNVLLLDCGKFSYQNESTFEQSCGIPSSLLTIFFGTIWPIYYENISLLITRLHPLTNHEGYWTNSKRFKVVEEPVSILSIFSCDMSTFSYTWFTRFETNTISNS